MSSLNQSWCGYLDTSILAICSDHGKRCFKNRDSMVGLLVLSRIWRLSHSVSIWCSILSDVFASQIFLIFACRDDIEFKFEMTTIFVVKFRYLLLKRRLINFPNFLYAPQIMWSRSFYVIEFLDKSCLDMEIIIGAGFATDNLRNSVFYRLINISKVKCLLSSLHSCTYKYTWRNNWMQLIHSSAIGNFQSWQAPIALDGIWSQNTNPTTTGLNRLSDPHLPKSDDTPLKTWTLGVVLNLEVRQN